MDLFGTATDTNVRLDKNTMLMDKTFISMTTQRTVCIVNQSDYMVHFQWKKLASIHIENENKNKSADSFNKILHCFSWAAFQRHYWPSFHTFSAGPSKLRSDTRLRKLFSLIVVFQVHRILEKSNWESFLMTLRSFNIFRYSGCKFFRCDCRKENLFTGVFLAQFQEW